MNKWIILFATLLITVGFTSTISTTIANPSGSNLSISIGLVVLIIAGLFAFYKADKNKKVDNKDGFTPIE